MVLELNPLNLEAQSQISNNWKVITSNSLEPIQSRLVSHHGSLDRITSTLEESNSREWSKHPSEHIQKLAPVIVSLDRPKTAFFVPLNADVAISQPKANLPIPSKSASLPMDQVPFAAATNVSSTPFNSKSLPYNPDFSSEILPSSSINMSQERRVSQPNLHSVSHSALRRPSLPNSETSLPTRAGNTINNFWKSMYLEQLDQSNQSDGSLSSLPSNSCHPIISQEASIPSLQAKKPPTVHTVLFGKQKAMTQTPKQQPKIISISNSGYHAMNPIRNPTSSTTVVPTAKSNPFEYNADHSTKSLQSMVQGFSSSLPRHDLESLTSFMTAPQFQDSIVSSAADPDSLPFANSTRSSVTGPRPNPWEEEDGYKFDIAGEAKTSTTTKAFKEMMAQSGDEKKGTITKLFRNAFRSMSELAKDTSHSNSSPPDQASIRTSISKVSNQMDSLLRNTQSRVIGPRDLDQSLPMNSKSNQSNFVDHDLDISQSRSRVQGSRPMPK